MPQLFEFEFSLPLCSEMQHADNRQDTYLNNCFKVQLYLLNYSILYLLTLYCMLLSLTPSHLEVLTFLHVVMSGDNFSDKSNKGPKWV